MAASFDEKKAYVAQEEVYFDDGREIELLHFVYGRPNIDELRGNPQKVLAAIDEYGRAKKYLMNVGEDKGRIVSDLIAKEKPETMVELGGYVGYSAVLFGDAFRKAGGKQYFSLERNPEFGAVISSLVDLAGLSDIVKVIIGPSDSSLRRLHREKLLSKIDLMFLDHYKPAYLYDTKLSEELGLIQLGTVLAADNVIKPGNPPYLEYVRASVEDKKAALRDKTRAKPDLEFDDKYSKMYEKREGKEKFDEDVKGVPTMVYQSELIKSFEPTGVPDGIEITRCIGKE